ncbi:hypothetical protein OSB04_011764 [Centaurea solstitialis]|uniref:Uncharacterized protein n=1 Tax=Centaurea solstitialis TaxID=347529 RepID=A0AA38WLT5_9ASTR|nr:hypothetical protein OSB04_011764 [Centaurea solstitialis]
MMVIATGIDRNRRWRWWFRATAVAGQIKTTATPPSVVVAAMIAAAGDRNRRRWWSIAAIADRIRGGDGFSIRLQPPEAAVVVAAAAAAVVVRIQPSHHRSWWWRDLFSVQSRRTQQWWWHLAAAVAGAIDGGDGYVGGGGRQPPQWGVDHRRVSIVRRDGGEGFRATVVGPPFADSRRERRSRAANSKFCAANTEDGARRQETDLGASGSAKKIKLVSATHLRGTSGVRYIGRCKCTHYERPCSNRNWRVIKLCELSPGGTGQMSKSVIPFYTPEESLKLINSKWKLTGQNFPVWKMHLDNVLRAQGKLYVLEKPVSRPESNSPERDFTQYFKYLADESDVMSILIFSTSPEFTGDLRVKSCHQLKKGQSVKDHLIEMRRLFKCLSRLGYKMTQEELVYLMWFSLTREIQDTTSAYMKEPKKDVDKVHEDILASLEPVPEPADLMETDVIDELEI